MLCRLCILDDNDYCKLEGAICDMLRAVLRKKYININNCIVCSSCVRKLEKAFEFKTTCLRTQKILSLYGGPNNKIVYVRGNKLCVSTKNDSTIKLCRICLRLIENGFFSNLLGKYNIIETLSTYVPEMVIDDTKTSLICYKCLDHFRIFSEIINITNETESMISIYCSDNGITNPEQISLEDIMSSKLKYSQNSDDEITNKLLGGNDNFWLALENELEYKELPENMEDSKKRIIKKIIEEDVDLFYKEKPDFDLIDGDYGSTFFGAQSRQVLLSESDEDVQHKRISESIEDDEPSVRLSFETEESSLSPGTLSDRHCYDCESQDEGKNDRGEVTSPNQFIFFNDYAQSDETCSCGESSENNESKTTKKLCDKCKWKEVLNYNYDTTDSDQNGDELVVKKPKKDGKKKCRKAYGIEFKDLWCTQCRWKKACTRFGNAKAVNRR